MSLSLLPLAPLLGAYRAARDGIGLDFPDDPVVQRRFLAQRSAPTAWLNEAFLDSAPDTLLSTECLRFAEAVVPLFLHPAAIPRRIRTLRFGLHHCLRGQVGLTEKFRNCATADGAYFVPGLGPAFWSAILQSLRPDEAPYWDSLSRLGAVRLGHERADYDERRRLHARIHRLAPDLTATHGDHFLMLVAEMRGREFPRKRSPDHEPITLLRAALRRVRARFPLKERLRHGESGNLRRGLRGFAAVDDALVPGLDEAAEEQLLGEAAEQIRERLRCHPLELSDLADELRTPNPDSSPSFGLCRDTFVFLHELADHNRKEWLSERRERYRFVVREPLLELAARLTERYVEPILNGEFGLDLETASRTGRVLSSICRNDYGRGAPYEPTQWLTYYPRKQSKRHAAQFFVRIDGDGAACGWRIGASAREPLRRFRKFVQEHGETLFAILGHAGTFRQCVLPTSDGGRFALRDAGDLRHWAGQRELTAELRWGPDDPLLRSDEWAGRIQIVWQSVLPLFLAAVVDDPLPILRRHWSGSAWVGYDPRELSESTFLPEERLSDALALLERRKQLILTGVPGTGKTFIARALARHLTHGNADALRLVQFHPSYGYEEFVEGMRPKSQTIDGRHHLSYPIEDGLLVQFATSAADRPEQPHVLLIDEINRGNLPRIFGELLYLLEYRNQEITLPISRRPFRLPMNLYLIGTMNSRDRSTAALDQALRRRFAFLELAPDPLVLHRFLSRHPPREETLAPRLLRLFETVNRRLAADLGAETALGHSVFMVRGLTEGMIRSIWESQVLPQIQEFFAGRTWPRLRYDFTTLWEGRARAAKVGSAES